MDCIILRSNGVSPYKDISLKGYFVDDGHRLRIKMIDHRVFHRDSPNMMFVSFVYKIFQHPNVWHTRTS